MDGGYLACSFIILPVSELQTRKPKGLVIPCQKEGALLHQGLSLKFIPSLQHPFLQCVQNFTPADLQIHGDSSSYHNASTD